MRSRCVQKIRSPNLVSTFTVQQFDQWFVHVLQRFSLQIQFRFQRVIHVSQLVRRERTNQMHSQQFTAKLSSTEVNESFQ